MNVLLISILLIVLAAIIYIVNYKNSTAKKEKKVTNSTSESKQKPKQGEFIKSSTEPEPLAEHDFKFKPAPVEPVESISYTTTTGENEYYKMKLKDPRWIELSKKIKARDHYRCVKCGSDGGEIVVLDSIEDLEPIVDFPEVYIYIKELFENQLNSNLSQEKGEHINQSAIDYIFLSSKEIVGIENKYLYTFLAKDLSKPNRMLQFVSHKLDTQTVKCNIIRKEKTLRYFKADKVVSTTDYICVVFVAEGSTDNQWILRQSINKSDNLVEFGGQGILTYNGLSIYFPLFSMDKKQALNVHHSVYYLDKEPWEFEEPYAELITLCHKCHMEAHKHPIPVK